MKTKMLLLAALLTGAMALTAIAGPIIIRHDRDEAVYLDLGGMARGSATSSTTGASSMAKGP